MATDFPLNLGNGENFLPYDIFCNDKNKISSLLNNSHLHHDHHRHLRRRQLACIDDLAHDFTALSLLQRQTQSPPKPLYQIPHHHLERFTPPVRTGPVQPQLHRCIGVSCGRQLDQRPHEHETVSFSSAGTKPGPDLQVMKPTPALLESYLKAKANMVLQRRQNRLLQQNRPVLPFKGSGFGFKGGFPRESGGTGVFHPRINTTSITSAASNPRKQSVSKKQEFQVTQQRNSTKRAASSNLEDCHYYLPPDMGLPQDWTY